MAGRGTIGSLAVVLVLLVPGFVGLGSGLARSTVLATGLPTGNNWTQLAALDEPQPVSRAWAAMGFDIAAGSGVLYGGQAPGGAVLADTWVNDGDVPGYWSNITDKVHGSPPALVAASMVYDPADGYWVLFGGRLANGLLSAATWEFRGLHDWVDVTAFQSISPPAQAWPSLAYDGVDGTVVLVSSIGPRSTWTFQGGNWSFLSPSSNPPLRDRASLVYDPIERSLVLFGGVDATGARNDTWEFAAGAWRSVASPTNPPASVTPTATYDIHDTATLLYLGDSPAATWEFSHGVWSAVAAVGPAAPSSRVGPMLYYDTILRHAVLFGGLSPDGRTSPSDVWGWAIPPVVHDPSLTLAGFSPQELGLLGAIVAAPIVLAGYLRRKPPRKDPVTSPESAPSGTGGI